MNIFMTGATGYIGGSVANRLLDNGHRILGLARKPEAAPQLKSRGIEPLIGSLNQMSLIYDAAKQADAVINTADSDHPWVVTTILKALKGSGKPFLHTSGSSIVGDNSAGEYTEEVHEDTAPIRHRFEKAGRVAIDLAVRAAASDGIRSAVLCPCMIYGKGTGLNASSIQIPMLIDIAKRSGAGRHIGRGLNVWSNVHINDVVSAFELALERAPAGSFFFLESGECSFLEIARAISTSLGFGGAAKTLSIDEALSAWSPEAVHFAFGSNSRVRGRNTRNLLGWRPSGKALIDDILGAS
jgi:nucleoside-diphosphate-sugar epimerase